MQKIKPEYTSKAKEIFKKYIKDKNIVAKTIEQIEKLQKNHPRTFMSELNTLKKHAHKNLFISNLDEINELIKEMKRFNEEVADFNSKKNKKQVTTKKKVLDRIKQIFNNLYDNFSKKDSGKAYEFIKALNTKACPYCNLNYIDVIISEEENILRPHLDHYYAESLYPYLALSFYNLIPSCHSCNSSLKLNKDFYNDKHVHPHDESFDDLADFVIDVNNINIYSDLNAFDVNISDKNITDKGSTEKVKKIKETFKLIERYNHHKDIAQEVLKKKKIYTPQYIEQIRNMLSKEGTDATEAAIELFITGNYTNSDDVNKRPFAKLTKDIWNLDI